MKTTYRFRLSLVLAALIALLAACAPATEPGATGDAADAPSEQAGDAANDAADAPSDEQITIRVGTGDSGEGLTPHQEIISRFEAEHPNITVQLEPVSGSDYYARLLTQIAAGDAPDIMNIGDDAVPRFVEAGAFLPLDDFIASDDSFSTDIYLTGLLDPGMYDGTLYFLPKDYSPLGVFYNKAIFDEYGVDYPADGWTWDDLLATAQALTIDEDGDGTPEIYGLQMPGPWTTGFEYWVAAAGGQLISEDGTQFEGNLNSPEVAEAVQFYQDLYHEYGVTPPPADMNAFGGGNSEFDNGQAAMRIFGRWPQGGYAENPAVDLAVAGVPQAAVRANVLFWGGFGIYSGTENAEAAWEFLSFYAGEQGAEVWQDWALPAVASVAESSGATEDPINGVWISELEYLAPRAYVYTPFWGEAADPALRTVLETVIIDPEAEVQPLLDQAAAEAQAALDEARE